MSDNSAPSLVDLLAESSIRLSLTAIDRDDAIRQTARALLDAGVTDTRYIDAMLERERSVSTYLGEGIAIPHGTLSGRKSVLNTGIVVLRFADGVDWDGEDVRVCIGIAAPGNGHIALLSQLASQLLRPQTAAHLRAATTSAEIYQLITPQTNAGRN